MSCPVPMLKANITIYPATKQIKTLAIVFLNNWVLARYWSCCCFVAAAIA